MAHIDVTAPDFGGGLVKTLRLSDFSGGVRLSDFSGSLGNAQCPHMLNMIYGDGILSARNGIGRVHSELVCSGNIHSASGDYFGYRVFHIGNTLVAVKPDVGTVISENMPDANSFSFEMNSVLYIFTSDARIFTVDKSLTFSEMSLPKVQILTEAKNDLSSFTECEIPDNMLVGAYSITYNPNTAAGLIDFTLAHEPDMGRGLSIYNIDTKSELETDYTLDGRVITLSKRTYSKIRITYFPKKGDSDRHFDKIFGCTTAICYGGRASGGTRVFFSGNPEYPGYYFYSELLDPLTVPLLSYDIIGNGSKEISALAKQRDDLVVLCKDSVYRISYSFSESEGADFTVSEISPVVGCDMPGSVQLVDNRLVFASSRKGIYIIVSSDYTDELSVRSISGNINGISGGGFFEAAAEGEVCCSIDFGRRYVLYIGDKAFVWDYGNTPYTLGNDPAYSERILSWYMLSGCTVMALFEQDGKMYGICKKDDERCFAVFTDGLAEDLGEELTYEIATAEQDVSMPEAKKLLLEVFVTVQGRSGAVISVTAFGDGNEIAAEDFTLGRASDIEDGTSGNELYTLYMRVPRYEAVRFSLKVASKGDPFGICDAVMRFSGKGIYYR